MKWNPEVEAALQDLKKYLSSPPVLVVPRPQKPLLLYLAATNQMVSAALVAQREVDEEEVANTEPGPDKPESSPARLGADKADQAQANTTEQQTVPKKKVVQRPVYFVSSLLQGARSRYSGV
jgi:hypothetical protein